LRKNVAPLINAMRHTQTINTAEIIAGVAAEDRSNGERIGSAFEAARLAAITAALES
jgi:tRNA nucleotidyltransferase (CCA-adding enzyme)